MSVDIENTPVESKAEALPEAPKEASEQVKAQVQQSLSDPIRRVQMLLVKGSYPGELALEVVNAWNLLDKIAKDVEAKAHEAK